MKMMYAARAAIVIGAAAAVVAGCSSSGTKSAGSSTAAGSTTSSSASAVSSPTGTPIKLMIMAVKNNPVLAQQEQFDAAQARVDSINASGGVNGHPLDLEECDTKLDPNAEQACLNQAVTDNVSAIVGSTILFSSFSNLEAAKIPLIGAQGITPSQLQSPISYPFGSIYAWFAGMVQMAKGDGVKTLSVDYLQTASAQFSDGVVLDRAKALGITVPTNLGTALTTTDYTADAATLTKGNPDGVAVVGSTGTASPLIKAMRDGGYSGKIYCLSADFTQQELSSYSSALEGVRVSNAAMPLSNTSDPGVKAYKADMAKYEPSSKQDENGELGWSGVEMYYQLMKKATAFTGADVIAAAELRRRRSPSAPTGRSTRPAPRRSRPTRACSTTTSSPARSRTV